MVCPYQKSNTNKEEQEEKLLCILFRSRCLAVLQLQMILDGIPISSIFVLTANRTLGFLRKKLFSCPQDVKEAVYKGLVLVRPVLEYGSSVWDPQGELEKVQNRAARFVSRNYTREEHHANMSVK